MCALSRISCRAPNRVGEKMPEASICMSGVARNEGAAGAEKAFVRVEPAPGGRFIVPPEQAPEQATKTTIVDPPKLICSGSAENRDA